MYSVAGTSIYYMYNSFSTSIEGISWMNRLRCKTAKSLAQGHTLGWD